MLAATHALTGAMIAAWSPTPAIGIAVAILSHPILDCVPHWDLRTRHIRRSKALVVASSLVDALLGFALGFFLMGNAVPAERLLLTMIAAQLPDWLEAPYLVMDWKFPPFSWVKVFQHRLHWKLPFPDGLYTQLILIFLLLLLTK